MKKSIFTAIVCLLALLSLRGQSSDLKRGTEFYNEGKYKSALPYLRRAAKAGEAAAQTLLGTMYGLGTGVETDTVAAMKMFNKAIGQNYAAAMEVLGDMCIRGTGGFPVNETRAFGLFKRAAELGYLPGMYRAGQCYYFGRGTARNPEESFRYCMKAAQGGYARAYEWMGDIYYSGNGTFRNYEQAFYWYEKAGKEGNLRRKSRYNLAWMLFQEKGCEFDPVRAETILKGIVKEDRSTGADPSAEDAVLLLASVRPVAELVKTRIRMSNVYRNCARATLFYDFDQTGNMGDTPAGAGKSCSFPPAGPLYADNPFCRNNCFSISFCIKDFSSDADIIRIPDGFPGVFIRNGRLILVPGFCADTQAPFDFPFSSLNDGKWHHIMLTFGNSEKILYVDGNKKETVRAAPSRLGRGTVCLIAGKGRMTMDNLRIYAAEVLSAEEAASVYYMEKERFACDTSVFTVSSPLSVKPAEIFRVKFVLKNREGIHVKYFPGDDFEILAGPSTSATTIVTNGKTNKEISYNYVLRPRKEGKCLLPKVTLIADGKEYRSPFTWVNVNSSARNSEPRTDTIRVDEFFFDNFSGISSGRSSPGDSRLIK